MKSGRTALKQRIGDVIRRHREAKSFTQEGFADHIEMHRAQYGLVEQGKRDLRVSTLERVAAGLGEPAWAILREAEGA
jgi:transcriptional regulator with XRE-family HTH domain